MNAWAIQNRSGQGAEFLQVLDHCTQALAIAAKATPSTAK
jgi:hypothetical protein